MTTTLNTSGSENTMVLSARVSACMYFLVYIVLPSDLNERVHMLNVIRLHGNVCC